MIQLVADSSSWCGKGISLRLELSLSPRPKRLKTMRGSTWRHARLLCQGPPCENCAHTPTQLACVVDVEVQAAAGSFETTSCWPKCAFARGSVPDVPRTCWVQPGSRRG